MVIRQRVSRYARKLDAADLAGDHDAVDRWDRLFRKAMAEEVAHADRPPAPPPAPTRAGQFTIESTIDMSDEELRQHWIDAHDDPHAREAIARVMEWRDERDAARDAEIAEQERSQEARDQFDQSWGSWAGRDPLHSPASRPHRALTADQRAREEYQRYTMSQYLRALDECKTSMLSARGKAAGVDEYDLFSGPAHVAKAHASEELQSWWRRNGRLSFSAFRHHLLGRDADRAAAERARIEDFGNVA